MAKYTEDDMTKCTPVPGGKLYGSPKFETGPARKFGHPEFQAKESYGSKPGMETGPKRTDAFAGKIGRKAGSDKDGDTGTKRDEHGEDHAGSSMKTYGSVRGK